MNKNGKLDANDFAMLRKGGSKQVADEDSTDNAFTAHKRPRYQQGSRNPCTILYQTATI